ncbi:MAG: serine kinase [Sphingopyxis sp.]|nr:serine kinase [Sphingopyxis sp.]
MYRYHAFGLLIASEWPLPELPPASSCQADIPDLSIKLADIRDPFPAKDAPPEFDYDDPLGTTMVWPFVGAFRISNPGLIEIQPAPGAEPDYIAFPLLGPVMGWLLHVRGRLVLHGSALSWRGKTIGFLGDKMAGKSTTAGAFLANGGSLLTDDLLVFACDGPGSPTVLPAFAQLKLSDESAEAICLADGEALPLVMEGFPKRQHRLSKLAPPPDRIDALFVLDRRTGDCVVDWLPQPDALTKLLRFSYNVRFANAPLAMQNRKRHFEQCAAMARFIPVGILSVPDDLTRLDEVTEFVARILDAAP